VPLGTWKAKPTFTSIAAKLLSLGRRFTMPPKATFGTLQYNTIILELFLKIASKLFNVFGPDCKITNQKKNHDGFGSPFAIMYYRKNELAYQLGIVLFGIATIHSVSASLVFVIIQNYRGFKEICNQLSAKFFLRNIILDLRIRENRESNAIFELYFFLKPKRRLPVSTHDLPSTVEDPN
jgi:hypothetical protein